MRNVLRISAFCVRIYYYYYDYYYYHYYHYHHRHVWRVFLSRHNSFRIMTGRAGRLRNRGSIPYSGKRFFSLQNVRTGLGTHAICYSLCLTTHLHQVPRLRMSGVMLHFPYAFLAWTGRTLPLYLFPCSKTPKTKFFREVRKLPVLMNRFEWLTLPWTILRNEELGVLCRSAAAVRVVDGMPVDHDRETSNAYGIHARRLGKHAFSRPRRRWQNNVDVHAC